MNFSGIVFVFYLMQVQEIVQCWYMLISLILCYSYVQAVTNVPNIHSIFLFMELKIFSHFHFCNSIAAMCIFGLAWPKGMRIFHFNRDYQIVFQKIFIKLYYHLIPKYYFPYNFAKL